MLINRIALIILSVVLISCYERNAFPVKISERFSRENVELNQPLFTKVTSINDTATSVENSPLLQDLLTSIDLYEKKDENFDLKKLEEKWNSAKMKNRFSNLKSYSQWIEITGFLLELTGNPVYATELQSIIDSDSLHLTLEELKILEQKLVPFIFMHDVDNIYLNVYANTTVQFEHTLKGKVKITTEIQDNGEVLVKFGMENKRMIELFLRIPDDAKSPAVTEKNVKYVAIPGEYSSILRKWGEGDQVEIQF